MRETDDEVIQKSSVFVDTRAGAITEAGDLTQAMDAGNFDASQVIAELSELCARTDTNSDAKQRSQQHSQQHKGRSQLPNPDTQITLFKSVGAGREDLAAAILAYEQMMKASG